MEKKHTQPFVGHRTRKSKIKERSGLGKAWDFLMARFMRECRSGVQKEEARQRKWDRQQREAQANRASV